jgi:hypothetical protein
MWEPRDDTAAQRTAASRVDCLRSPLGYNRRFDSTHLKNAKIMEAERINAISALLNDLTGREAELRRYL